MPQRACGNKKTMFQSQFFPATISWGPGIKLRLLDLCTKRLIRYAILPASTLQVLLSPLLIAAIISVCDCKIHCFLSCVNDGIQNIGLFFES